MIGPENAEIAPLPSTCSAETLLSKDAHARSAKGAFPGEAPEAFPRALASTAGAPHFTGAPAQPD
jgi:hypothetical protein